MPDASTPLTEEIRIRMTDDRPQPPGKAQWVTADEPWIWQLRQELLPDLHPSMPRVLIQDQPPQYIPKRGAIPRAYTKEALGDPHIYVSAFSDAYRKARRGDSDARKELAAILAHEYEHIYRPQTGEAGAYAAQIDRLRRLGASSRAIREAERAREYTISRLR